MQTVLVITGCWTLLLSLLFVVEYFFVYDLLKLEKLAGTYDFWPDFTGTAILAALGGFVFGYVLVFKLNPRYSNRSFAFGIVNAALLFIGTFLVLAIVGLFVLGFLAFVFQDGVPGAARRSFENVILNISTPSFAVSMVVWALLVAATQFMLQVSDKFGPGNLWKFITGKYYQPRQEERIFMFLDLKSATAIAEVLGSRQYFALLKEVYSDITDPIIESRGEIYQYVGDEVVITWPVDSGLDRNNCLLCFFRIEGVLRGRGEYYSRTYGLYPSFKAGLHVGEATVGEIGVIKKDIVYSGDVLNTTSRIQAECNRHDVSLLLSAPLLERLPLNGEYSRILIGEIQLRGKTVTVALHAVRANTETLS